jgi:predicted RNA-binding Zn-ribbon protein involved in translation (DUF1610 family)
MMPGKHSAGQVIEETMAHVAKVSLSVGLGFIASIFDDFGSVAVGAFDSVFPSKVPNHFVAFGIVDQSVNVQTHRVHEYCPTCTNYLISGRITICQKTSNTNPEKE